MGLDTVSPQPKPTPGRESITDVVIRDLVERREGGIKKYGMELQIYNGRSMITDAYQEALDFILYLRGRIMEESDHQPSVQNLEKVLNRLRILLPQVRDKWFMADAINLVENTIRNLTPPEQSAPLPPATSSPLAS
jgi:hypothetical protein